MLVEAQTVVRPPYYSITLDSLCVSGSSVGSTTSILFYNTGLSVLVEAQTVVRPPCYSITLSVLVEAQSVVRPPCYSITLASLC